MSLEAELREILSPLVTNRIFPDVAQIGTQKPYITYQQVGGQPVNFLESTPPGRHNARMQINCWAQNREAANKLAHDAENLLLLNRRIQASVLNSLVSTYEEDLVLYGTIQDFSIWY